MNQCYVVKLLNKKVAIRKRNYYEYLRKKFYPVILILKYFFSNFRLRPGTSEDHNIISSEIPWNRSIY
jgi:hypothetical protein